MWFNIKEKLNNKRTKHALIGSISIVVSRFCSLALGLLLTAIVARYLSYEEFGLWAILTFSISIIPVLDIGMGLALRNKLSTFYSNKNNKNEESKIYFFSVFYTYVYIALIFIIFIYFLGHIIPWGALFNTDNLQLIEKGAFSFILVFMILVISLPFAVSTIGFFSYQETHWNAFFEFLKSLLAISSISLLIIFHSGFTVLVVFFSIAMLLPVIISFIVFLKKRGWELIVVKAKILTSKIKELINKSIQFGLMQLSSTLMFSMHALIVGKVVGLKDAGEYALVQKLFLILNILQFAVLTPLWSAYTEAIASKDISWVKKVLMYSIIYSVLLFTIGSIALYFFGIPIIFLWTGKIIKNTLLYALMGIWVFTTGWVSCFSVYLNGIGRLKVQTILLVLSAIIYIPLALYLGTKLGVIGVCMASTIVLIPLAISNPIQSIMSFKHFDSVHKDDAKKYIFIE